MLKPLRGSGLRRRAANLTTAIIPNLITLGNAVCGFVALTLISRVEVDLDNLRKAAWCIILGMLFDVFDGRVARMTGTTSNFGAQLDSFSDLVTFGLAPAGLMLTLHDTLVVRGGPWHQIVWVFGLAYFLGAMLRLARFNTEHDESESAHLCFKGMPTPGAAGCIAGLVLVYFWLHKWESWELRELAVVRPEWVEVAKVWIARVLPFAAFLAGYAMVSNRLFYPHFASVLVNRRHSFDTFVYMVFGLMVAFLMIEPFLCVAFVGYMLWTPISTLYRVVIRRQGWMPAELIASSGADELHEETETDADDRESTSSKSAPPSAGPGI
ncbi:MAG: CDP-alcohol phosphatidyltransferase family protein [Planctomycetota bacterium]